MSYEVPGFIEGSDHSLVEGTFLRSSQVLLQLLYSWHANDDSITMLALEQQIDFFFFFLKQFQVLMQPWQISLESFSQQGTFSLEWWYIQRMAAEVKVGFSEPYTVSRAFRTTSTAWKWLFFQYLIRKSAFGGNSIVTTQMISKNDCSFTCLGRLWPSCCRKISLQAGTNLCLHNGIFPSGGHLDSSC